ncbi:hypothetical protein B0I35DRAFT_423329, partial [Stachybotrys elegans]
MDQTVRANHAPATEIGNRDRESMRLVGAGPSLLSRSGSGEARQTGFGPRSHTKNLDLHDVSL